MRSLRCACFVTLVLMYSVPPAWSTTASKKQNTETATQFYLRWRTTVLNAKSLDELTPFWTAAMKDELNMEPDSAKAETLPMMKRVYSIQTDVTVVRETATLNGATLSLEALDNNKKPVVGSVDIVKESGAWKMTGAVEQWKPKGN